MSKFFIRRPIVAIVIAILTDKPGSPKDVAGDNALLAEAAKIAATSLH